MTGPAASLIRLNDGRALGYMECGDPQGSPVFYFHGFPGSRLEVMLVSQSAIRQNVHLIGIDRPGYGTSDNKPGRKLTDWPDDVVELADHFGFDRFAVLGASGGAPYAAACAYKIPDRLTAAGIVCGLGPIRTPRDLFGMTWINRFGLRLIGRVPMFAKLAFIPAAFFLRYFPQKVLAFMARRAREPDRTAMRTPEIRQIMTTSFRESMRSGPAGAIRDLNIYITPWGFGLGEIQIRVHLWHGEKDAIVPCAMGRHMAVSIPDCVATFYAGEGHFSLVKNHLNAFLTLLAE